MTEVPDMKKGRKMRPYPRFGGEVVAQNEFLIYIAFLIVQQSPIL